MQTSAKARVANAASLAWSMSSLPAVGNALVVEVLGASGGAGAINFASSWLTDNQGNSYSLVKTQQVSGKTSYGTAIYLCPRIVTSSGTFTLTLTGDLTTHYFVVAAVEVGGLGGGTRQLVVAQSTSTTSATNVSAATSGSTTSVTGESFVAATLCRGAGAVATSIVVEAMTPVWTEDAEELDGLTYIAGEFDSHLSAVTGTQTANWTTLAVTSYAAVIVAFQSAASQAVTGVTRATTATLNVPTVAFPAAQAVTTRNLTSVSEARGSNQTYGRAANTYVSLALSTGLNWCQPFTGHRGTLTDVHLFLLTSASPTGSVYIELRQDTYNGTLLATSNQFNGSDIDLDFEMVFTFTPIVLDPAKTYWINLFLTTTAGGGTITVDIGTDDWYPRGELKTSTGASATPAGTIGRDFNFGLTLDPAWTVAVAGGGPPDQAVTTNTVASTAALNVSTVAPGPVTVLGTTVATTLALTVPLVGQTATGATCATTAVLNLPTVVPGPVTILATTLATSLTTFLPTVALGSGSGDQALSASTLASTALARAPLEVSRFNEFYAIGGSGSDTAAGSTQGASTVAQTNGAWDQTLATFTAVSGTPFSGVTAGEWGSIYVDGATTLVFLAQVATINGGGSGVTFSTTANYGGSPTSSANARSCKIGGAWANPWAFIGIGTTAVYRSTRINIKSGTYASTTVSKTFNNIGSNLAPLLWRGYNTTPGDIEANPLNATYQNAKPLLTWTTGNCTISGLRQEWSNVSFQSAVGSSTAAVSVQNEVTFTRCRFEYTGTFAGATACAFGTTQGGNFAECVFKAPSTSTRVATVAIGCGYINCVFTGGQVGLECTGSPYYVYRCVFMGLTSHGISSTAANRLHVIHCSFLGCVDGIRCSVAPTGPGTIRWNLFVNCSGVAINNTSGTTTQALVFSDNDFYNNTGGNYAGWQADQPNYGGVTESSNPTVGSTDPTFSAGTFNGASLTRDYEGVTFTGGKWDVGAAQRQV